MENIKFEEFIDIIKEYNPDEVEIVTKAYLYAKNLHEGQFRQSGEPYIIHPLAVASILAEMKADKDTVCAALLHDTLEDTDTTKEEIALEFNESIATLVDGVTKISKLNFSTKEDKNMANTRKIITGICDDVRIIIIKLADRLHNMRTLGFKSEFKQKENALETIDIFVPLAYYIGAYRIKSELEDLSLRYLKPDVYEKILDRKLKIEDSSKDCLDSMVSSINDKLNEFNIDNSIKVRVKNVYGIYKRLESGHKFSDIHDLFSLKIMVDTIGNCYQTLGLVHNMYHPVNERFKDYICNGKTNMYQSLHSTLFGPEGRLVQTQIRTFEMDEVASFGLARFWYLKKGDARYVMQKSLKEKFQFFKSLIAIDAMFGDNKDFVNQVKSELFSKTIYVYDSKGDIIELPSGATPIDFAYKLGDDVGNTMAYAIVNDEYVVDDYRLNNKDRVRIITDDLSFGPKKDWEDKAITSYAKKRIREFNDGINFS